MIDLAVLVIGLIIPSVYLAYTDLTKRLLYTKVVYSVALIGIIYTVMRGDIKGSIVGLAVGAGAMLLVAIVGTLGGGDIRYAGALGIWLGFPYILDVLLIASILALVSKGYINLRNKKKGIPKYSKDMELTEEVIKLYGVPFGTCMAIGLIMYIILTIIFI